MTEVGTPDAETRPALSAQPSMHDMNEIPTPNGLAKREITKFTDTWNNICRNSMVGQGFTLQAAAIASHAGNIFSCSPDDFLPTIEQIGIIVKAMTNPGLLAIKGINIAGEKFTYSSCQVSGSTAHCFTGERADGNGGVLVYITVHTILVGVYNDEGQKPREDAIALMEDIWNWVRKAGF